MLVVEQPREQVKFIWPPAPGKTYEVPVDQGMAIGDAFLWTVGNEQRQMQVIGINNQADGKRKVWAVLD